MSVTSKDIMLILGPVFRIGEWKWGRNACYTLKFNARLELSLVFHNRMVGLLGFDIK